MMECNDIVEVSHERSEARVCKLLKEGWVVLASAPGKDEDGTAYILHALGKPKSICEPTT